MIVFANCEGNVNNYSDMCGIDGVFEFLMTRVVHFPHIMLFCFSGCQHRSVGQTTQVTYWSDCEKELKFGVWQANNLPKQASVHPQQSQAGSEVTLASLSQTTIWVRLPYVIMLTC